MMTSSVTVIHILSAAVYTVQCTVYIQRKYVNFASHSVSATKFFKDRNIKCTHFKRDPIRFRYCDMLEKELKTVHISILDPHRFYNFGPMPIYHSMKIGDWVMQTRSHLSIISENYGFSLIWIDWSSDWHSSKLYTFTVKTCGKYQWLTFCNSKQTKLFCVCGGNINDLNAHEVAYKVHPFPPEKFV